jgi:hypothetical protein
MPDPQRRAGARWAGDLDDAVEGVHPVAHGPARDVHRCHRLGQVE